jgi:hypothetical protein
VHEEGGHGGAPARPPDGTSHPWTDLALAGPAATSVHAGARSVRACAIPVPFAKPPASRSGNARASGESSATIAGVMAGTRQARERLPGTAVLRSEWRVWRDETGTEPARLRIEQHASWLGRVVWDHRAPPWAPEPNGVARPFIERRLIDPSDLNIILESDLKLRPPPLPDECSASDTSGDESGSEAEEERAERRGRRESAHAAAVVAAEAAAAEAAGRDRRAVLTTNEWTQALARGGGRGLDGLLANRGTAGAGLLPFPFLRGTAEAFSGGQAVQQLAAAVCGGWGGFSLAERMAGGGAAGAAGCLLIFAQVRAKSRTPRPPTPFHTACSHRLLVHTASGVPPRSHARGSHARI